MKMSKEFDINRLDQKGENIMEFMGMPLGAALFLGGVLLGFGGLDITMLISLL